MMCPFFPRFGTGCTRRAGQLNSANSTGIVSARRAAPTYQSDYQVAGATV